MSPAVPAACVETHSAVVMFVGERAYKLKKPLDLGFVDLTRRQAREAICHREVELNRRLAPDVYLGVADVLGPDGQPCDHLVVMKRMPEERRLSSLVSAGAEVEVDVALQAVAGQLAGLHRATQGFEPAAATAAAQRARWRDNTDQMLDLADVLDPDVVREIDRLAGRYLDGRGPLFDERIDAGRSSDGHGDLQADDIFCLDDGPRILDCLEFDDSLRVGDGVADAAFLAMDLERLGRPDLAARWLDHYARASHDVWPASLVHHHIAHRAQIRAKVEAIRAHQGVGEAAPRARHLLGLCLDHLRAARVRLVVVGGLPGTGKSTVARGVAAALGAEVLRSDVIRKELEPNRDDGPGRSFESGLYAPEVTERTYRELVDRARHRLERGLSVVLDASFVTASPRAAVRALAAASSTELVELCCIVTDEEAHRRLARRALEGGDPSDATPEVAVAMGERFDAWPEATALDTGPSPAQVLGSALEVVR